MSGPLLSVKGLRVQFGEYAAVDDISLQIDAGETLGLVGESGSGKSTLARALMRLIPAARGQVLWHGEDILKYGKAAMRKRRRDLQMVFQDPLASLNPRLTVGDSLAEPLKIFESGLTFGGRNARISEMLERVGLSADLQQRYPHEFSGGQCQRIGIARAMMLRPKLLICDEPVSSLDVSIQGQIVNLLVDLQQEFGTAVLFISHNLAVVRHLSHRVAVMFRGRLVEVADSGSVFAAPAHPYTRALLAAVPGRTAARAAGTSAPEPEPEPYAAEVVTGCAFYNRCPYRRPICRDSVPDLETVNGGHAAACHRWREVVYS